MTNEEIYKKLISSIETLLESHNEFKYAASNNCITDVFLDKEKQRINFKREGKSETANFDNIKKIANAFSAYEPVSLEAVFNGGGNARSALEAIIVRLPQVGFLAANSKLNSGPKRLLWLSTEKNQFNSIYNVEQSDLDQANLDKNVGGNKSNNGNIESASNFNTFHIEINKNIQKVGLRISLSNILRTAAALLTKPFVILTGLSGSGKTKLAEAIAYWLSEEAENQICMVAVGADWTNNEPLLGYADAITPGRYCAPASGILQLLDHAINTPHAPHFLILDEMNLSHVERYFADFLSAMESSDPALRLHGSDKDLEISEAFKVPAKLALPPNVFIIGTVNVDETTYMFSPKVLDRANVIEFRVAAKQMEAFLSAPAASVNVSKLAGEGATYAQAFTARANPKMQVHLDATVSAQLQQDLMELFQPLADVGAEFGYRSAKEVARFVAIHREISGEGWQYKDALDAQVMQKLMPKLHGSKRKLDGVMAALKVFAVKHDLPLTLDKVERMNKRLDRDGFTSFAEN